MHEFDRACRRRAGRSRRVERADDLDAGDLAQLRLQTSPPPAPGCASRSAIVLEAADGVELVDFGLADIDEIGSHVRRPGEDLLDLRRIAVGEGERRAFRRLAGDLDDAAILGRRQFRIEAA